MFSDRFGFSYYRPEQLDSSSSSTFSLQRLAIQLAIMVRTCEYFYGADSRVNSVASVPFSFPFELQIMVVHWSFVHNCKPTHKIDFRYLLSCQFLLLLNATLSFQTAQTLKPINVKLVSKGHFYSNFCFWYTFGNKIFHYCKYSVLPIQIQIACK